MHAALRRQTLADLLRRTAKRFPNKTAIICGDTRWSYAEFDAVSDRLAAGLAARGVGKGARVAILSRNSHAFAALRFALARLGAVLVPINFMLKPEEAAFILKHAGADCWRRILVSPRWREPRPRSTPTVRELDLAAVGGKDRSQRPA